VSDEVLSLAYDRLTDSSFGLEMAAAPKAMADMVESLAGAICVDTAFDLVPVFEVLLWILHYRHHHVGFRVCSCGEYMHEICRANSCVVGSKL
jgi:dsRNA-specific ribonuclease